MRLLILLCLLALPLRATLNESVLLDAIADVETGNRDVRGAAGERGAYQLTPAVASRVGGYDRRAAHRWLKIVLKDMKRHSIDINVWNVGCVWNGGLTAVRRNRVADSTHDYANRLASTYQSRFPRAPARPPSKPFVISLTPPMFTIPSHP